MTEVAFHFNAPDKLAYACRLLRKAVGAGAKAVVVGHPADLDRLDTQLWTFGPLEFVPHCRADSPPELRAASPVVLSAELTDDLPHREVLLNLGDQVVAGFESFQRVIEVVSLEAEDRVAARQRWKHYADRGYDLLRHDLQLKDAAVG